MSSLHCPQCKALIEQDFGVITCQQCGSVLMVDLEGNIQLSGQDREAAQPHEQPREPAPISIRESELASESLVESSDFSGDEAVGGPVESSLATEESFAAPAEPDFRKEILEFANSELQSGPLSYSLVVEKIDSGELRMALREVLSHEKFNLDVEGLVASIAAGRLEIKGLNAVKASLLVQKLRRFPFELSWRQHAFSS